MDFTKRDRTNNAEREVIQGLEADGWTVYTRGWPDLLCTKEGDVKMVEVKVASNRNLSKHQTAIIDVLRSVGLTVEVIVHHRGGRTPRPILEAPVLQVNHIPAKALRNSRKDGEVRITKFRNRIHVSAPFTEEFRLAARRLRGRYRPLRGIWTFKIQYATEVTNALVDIYGKGAIYKWIRQNQDCVTTGMES